MFARSAMVNCQLTGVGQNTDHRPYRDGDVSWLTGGAQAALTEDHGPLAVEHDA